MLWDNKLNWVVTIEEDIAEENDEFAYKPEKNKLYFNKKWENPAYDKIDNFLRDVKNIPILRKQKEDKMIMMGD